MLNVDIIKEQVGYNKPATEAEIRICNLKLKQNKLPELPTEYADLLKKCNGLSNEDAKIFGVEIKNNNWYKDIVNFNTLYFHGNSTDWLILGENDSFFFIYNSGDKKYLIADRDTLEEEWSENDFMPVLIEILRIE
jgi:hypothetical protein